MTYLHQQWQAVAHYFKPEAFERLMERLDSRSALITTGSISLKCLSCLTQLLMNARGQISLLRLSFIMMRFTMRRLRQERTKWRAQLFLMPMVYP